MEEYGFRGTALITGALSLNAIPAMALMHPPSNWDTKFRGPQEPTKVTTPVQTETIEENDQQKEPLVPIPSRELVILKKGDKWNSLRSLHDRNTEPLLVNITHLTFSIF